MQVALVVVPPPPRTLGIVSLDCELLAGRGWRRRSRQQEARRERHQELRRERREVPEQEQGQDQENPESQFIGASLSDSGKM